MSAIFKREFRAYFMSPMGYIVVGILVFFQSLFFAYLYSIGSPDLSYIFSQCSTITLFVVPVLTMRTMSEDRKQKVDQVLLTSPVGLYSIVFGKFFATFSVYMMSYAVTVIFQIIVAFQKVTVNLLAYLGYLLGTALFGAALIALGIFISSLTESQFIAAIGSYAFSLLCIMIDFVESVIDISWVTKLSEWISFTGRFNAFTTGVIDYSNIVFFVCFAAVFIFLTVRVLDKRRYS